MEEVDDEPRYEACTDESALNHLEEGTCTYGTNDTQESADIPPPVESGCTDPEAENYNDSATEDDGSCTYEEPPCTDSDGDGVCAEDDACDDNPDANTEEECETEDD